MANLTVSVVIPVLNDPGGLAQTLDSLISQRSGRPKYEIIVVDNGSFDQTDRVIQDYVTRCPSTIKGTSEVQARSSYAARNKGIAVSHGEIIVFIDSNVTVGDTFLSQINTYFEAGIQYLGCNVVVTSDQSTLAGKYNVLSGFNTKRSLGREGFAQTCCLAVTRRVIATAGGFDSRLLSGGDCEFGNRVQRSGFALSFAPDIEVNHPARTSTRALLKKSFRIGRGVRQLVLNHPGRFSFMARKWYSVWFFLPPRMGSFHAKVRLSLGSSISKKQAVGFFLIMWLNKIAKHAGYLYEYVFYRLYSKP